MKFSFNRAQTKQLAQTSGNLSIVFFGSVISQTFTRVDDIDLVLVVLGVLIGVIFFIESSILLKGIKDDFEH